MNLFFRIANITDEELYLTWANDDDVRENAFNTQKINSEDHHRWFNKKLNEKDALLLVFMDELNIVVGQVRIDKGDCLQVDISLDFKQRGKGYGVLMLKRAIEEYTSKFGKKKTINSFIKKENKASIRIFEKAGFKLDLNEENKVFYKYIFVS